MKHTYIYLIIILLSFSSATFAQKKTETDEELTGMRAIGSPSNPKVKMSWRKYHDYAHPSANLTKAEIFGY
jgi:hypothetical protein